MLRPRWRKVVRDVSLHKSRTLLVVLAISIGIVGAGSVLNTWSLVRRVTAEEFRVSNPASATLRVDAIDDRLLAGVRALRTIDAAEARRTMLASIRTEGGWRTLVLFVSPSFDKRIGALKREAGTWPSLDGSIAIEASSVEFAGAAIGQALDVKIGEQTRALTVAGIGRDVGLAPGWMEHVVYAFATPATVAAFAVPTAPTELQIVVKSGRLDRDGVRRVAYDVKALAERMGHSVTDVDVPVPGRHIHAGQIDSLLFTQGAFGALALLLSAILVLNLISAMLAGQVREIGIMKAVGARGGQIARMYLVLALALGFVACVIAVPLAAVVGRGYAQFTADILNFDIRGFEIPRWSFALQIAVGALLPVAAASIPVMHGCRVSVAVALRDVGITNRPDDGAGIMRRVGGLSRPVLLSLRNAFRRRQRMILTLLTLATGGAVYLGALNLRKSVVGSVDLLYAAQHYDMVVRFSDPHAPDSIVALVSRVPGVMRTEAWTSARAARVRNDGMMGNTFPITAAPAETKMLDLAIVRGRRLGPADTAALVVSRRLAEDDPTFEVGKTVTLMIDGRTVTWTVVGVADAGLSPAAYATREALIATRGGGATSAVVATNAVGSASQLDFIGRLRDDLRTAGLEVQTGQLMTQQRAIMQDHLLMVVGFLGIMGQLMIVVGGLGLASTMSLSVLERTREIGVLRAIGARHGAILTMVHVEGLVIALFSWLLALPLSLPVSLILGQAFGRIMLPVPVTFIPEPFAALRWLGVVVIVSLAACTWPAYAAMRVTTAAALSYE
jgi:putative ABC transport system permease protein